MYATQSLFSGHDYGQMAPSIGSDVMWGKKLYQFTDLATTASEYT
jgi:hypothetical protein